MSAIKRYIAVGASGFPGPAVLSEKENGYAVLHSDHQEVVDRLVGLLMMFAGYYPNSPITNEVFKDPLVRARLEKEESGG